MAVELYNMPLQVLTNEQIRKVVTDAIKQERKLKKINKCKKTIPEEIFFKWAKANTNEAIQFG